MTILIMGLDEHATAIRAALGVMEEPCLQFSSRGDHSIVGTEHELGIYFDGVKHSHLNSVVYWRSYDGVCECNTEEEMYNRRSLFETWLKHMSHHDQCFNPWDAWAMHRTKPWQNRVMAEIIRDIAWLEMPVHYYNRPRSTEGQSVYKGAQGGAPARFEPKWDQGKLEYACQEYIKGITYRVYVFPGGDEPIWTRINASTLDYREDPKCPCETIRQCTKSIDESLEHLVSQLGWRWAGIDIIKDESGLHYVLDVNPSPMFMGFDRDGSIVRAVCNMLREEIR